MNGKLPYDKKIERELYEGILKGLSVYKIHDKISHWQNCPKTRGALYKNYSEVISKARVEYEEKILGLAHDRMAEGSDKLIELALRSKVGWNPVTQIKELDADEVDEGNDAVSIIMEKLGKAKPKDEK